MKYYLILLATIILHSCKSYPDLPTVKTVDINKYAGTWYEIARLPNRFEKGLKCVTAEYRIKDNGKIDVINKGYSPKGIGEYKTANGTAWVPDPNFPGRLKVRFFWPFTGNYYIIALDENHTYALVGDPSRDYLWVLSKNIILEDSVYDDLLKIAEANGFAIENLVRIEHDCNK